MTHMSSIGIHMVFCGSIFSRVNVVEKYIYDYVHDNAQMVQPVAMVLKIEGSDPKAGNSLYSNVD